MSVQTSSANIEPPPLLFGQRSPSPPSFSSPPQSPNHLHHTQTPMASPPPHPQTAEDIDMSTSTTLPPAQGQNHDREDAVMEDNEGLTNGNIGRIVENGHNSAPQVAVEVAAVEEDAMDTTPDTIQADVIPNASTDAPGATELNPSSPTSNGWTENAPTNGNQEPVPPGTIDNDVQQENIPPIQPPPIFDPQDPNSQPPATEQPPPPPPVETSQIDSDSSDDDGGQSWQPIEEDTSTPDEQELKEIEETGGEYSATNHMHWEEKAFQLLDEPEYTPGESGRIEWLVEHYNGTKEQPNRELVMKSPPKTIAGHEWQIKFYPKGNDSDYLSIYVECLSVTDKADQKAEESSDGSQKPEDVATTEDAMPTKSPEIKPIDAQHAPLPLLDSKPIPKRRSVAAQVSVVLYNPEEPRENYSRTCLHRFCTGSPDWGWTRFHGPIYDIQHRLRGHRAALLRNDKLAFTAYIRVVNDETDCLWEHHSRDNPWDSFAMTGLQSLSLPEDRASSSGGNLISAIASRMLFKPFRLFLHQFRVPDLEKEPFIRPKPLLAAFQKLLYLLRTQVKPGSGSLGLDDVVDALEWYGITSVMDKYDVIEVWEVFRCKFEEELEGTPYATVLDELFGRKKDYRSGIPSYRLPIKGHANIQDAVLASNDVLHPSQTLPQLLTVELERQEFNTTSRSWVKLTKKVALEDTLRIANTDYTLYGFVVHKDNLQSYLYHPVLRPEGPGTKWYNYTDGRDENLVRCLTKQQVKAYEGSAGSDNQTGRDSVAYIAMYVRNDVATTAFKHNPEHEKWDVPEWIVNEVEKDQAASVPPPSLPTIPPEPRSEQLDADAEKPTELPATKYHFHIIDSKAFAEHEGPGTFDAYDTKWQPGNSEYVHTIELLSTDGCEDIRKKIASIIKGVQDPRQIKYWFLDALRGTISRPNLLSPGQLEYSSTGNDYESDQSGTWSLQQIQDSWSCSRIWIHIIDFDKLPELPKEEPKVPEPEPVSIPEAGSSTSQGPPPPAPEIDDTSVPEPPLESQPPTTFDNPLTSEDTPMSEVDEPEPQSEPQTETENQTTITEENVQRPDTTMEIELAVEAPQGLDLPPVEVVIPVPPLQTDTEMGGTQEDLLPPPPPPAELQNAPPPPPPAPFVPPEEIYFFLKFFDAETQTLTSRGSHYALKSARVDTTVLLLLDLPPDTTIELHEEQELIKTHHLRLRRSFSQNDLQNTAIVIVMRPVTDELRSTLASRCAFAEPQSYLSYRANIRNFTDWMNGHFTFGYFSSQYYKGEMRNGYKHGHGTRIYHSGATYSGTFRLNKRHGHGLYTYQNGDTYDGEWVDNQQHGIGTFVEASTGNTYVGGWKNDKKFGEGVTHWKNAQETERLCRICWEEGAEAAFYDCGHVVACLSCARRVDSCPVCRKRVLSAMKLYYVA